MRRRRLTEEQVQVLFFGTYQRHGLDAAINAVHEAGALCGPIVGERVATEKRLSSAEKQRLISEAMPVLMRVADRCGITVDEIQSGCKSRAVAQARQIVIWLLRRALPRVFTAANAAVVCGLTDHSSAVSAFQRADAELTDVDKAELLAMVAQQEARRAVG